MLVQPQCVFAPVVRLGVVVTSPGQSVVFVLLSSVHCCSPQFVPAGYCLFQDVDSTLLDVVCSPMCLFVKLCLSVTLSRVIMCAVAYLLLDG
jgi:hypothetical protein